MKPFLLLTLLVASFGAFGIWLSCDLDKEEAFAYDYDARFGNWDAIIERASKQAPTDAFSLAYLNLALAKKGILAETMFDFPQIGTEGLLAPFKMDCTSPLPASEAYFQMGNINTAQRYAYEMQEAIPDFQKSGRMHKRLAETYIINGDFTLARKTLNTLSLTWAYRTWAKQQLNLLDNSDSTKIDALYGKQRALDYKNDYFYQDNNTPNMLGLQFSDKMEEDEARGRKMEEDGARIIYEYLMAWALLERDLPRFYQYFNLPKDFDCPTLPKSYQEALMILWSSQTNTVEGMPWTISPQIAAQTRNFLSDMSIHDLDYLRQKYHDTYFLYFIDK